MNNEKSSYKNLRILLAIFPILISLSAIIPSYSNSEIGMNTTCIDTESESELLQDIQEEDIKYQSGCLPDDKKELIKLYIIGLINIDELTMWVLGVDRRLIVLKMMHEKRLMQAADIADATDRSLQNISYAMRELEERGLIKCLTPGKHTWKKFIPTEEGTQVFEKLKENRMI